MYKCRLFSTLALTRSKVRLSTIRQCLLRSTSELGHTRAYFDSVPFAEFDTLEATEACVRLLGLWREHYYTFRFHAVPVQDLLREIAMPLLAAHLDRTDEIVA